MFTLLPKQVTMLFGCSMCWMRGQIENVQIIEYIKMVKSKNLLCLLFVAMPLVMFGGKGLNNKATQMAQSQALEVIKNYQISINKIGKTANADISKAKYYSEELIKLFIDRKSFVYNDLDTSYSKNYEIETYARNIILRYKKGIEVDLDFDNARSTYISYFENDTYVLDVIVQKKISGIYLEKDVVKRTEELTFRIAFDASKNDNFSNFRIVGIRKVIQPKNNLNLIESEIKTKLQDYVNFLSLIGDTKETDKDKMFYRDKFVSLFTTHDVEIWNDVNQSPKALKADDYLKVFEEKYSGKKYTASFEFDSIKFGNVSELNQDVLITNIETLKHVSYVDDNGKMSYKPQKYIISFVFKRNENMFSDFLIAGMQEISKEHKNIEQFVLEAKPTKNIKYATRKGFEFGAYSGIGQNEIYSADLLEQSPYGVWEVKTPATSLTFGASISFFPIKNLRFTSGVEYVSHKSIYSISADSISNEDVTLLIQINHIEVMPILKVRDAYYDSTLSINSIKIPLLVGYHYSIKKIGMFVSAGASLSYTISTAYTTTGNYAIARAPIVKRSSAGISADFAVPFLYDYLEKEHADIEKKEIADFNFAIDAKLGFEYFINRFTALNCGLYYSKSLADVEKGSSFVDMSGIVYEHKPSFFESKGIFFGVTYKL